MERPLLSVIIACRNRPVEISTLLRDLRRQDYAPLEIVVVDDGSTPALPPLEVDLQIRNEVSSGLSAARNLAIERSRGELIVNFDDDVTLPAADLLSRSVELALAHTSAAAIGFRQRHPDGSLRFAQPANSETLCRTSRFFGYGFLVRRSAIARTGPFFPAIAFGGEELELSLRLLDAGYDILYAPSLELIHHESEIGRDWRRMRRLTLRNQSFATLLRHPWWFVPASLAVQTARFIAMTSRMEGVEWGAISFAAAETVRHLGMLIREREPVRFATLRRNRALNLRPEAIGGGVSESNRPFDASAPKQRF